MEVDTTIVDRTETATSFILRMACDHTRVLIFTKKKKRPKFHALLPTPLNLLIHVLRDQLLVMLWNICDGILLLHFSALTQLCDGSSCQCRAQEICRAGCGIFDACHTVTILAKRDAATSTQRERENIQKGVEMQHFA